jgi:hypothetical protein
MASLAFTLPILPGKTQEFRRFAQEVLGPRRDKHEATRQPFGGSGITKELAWIQQTPQGDILIVYLEGDDPVSWFQDWMSSQDPHDRWFKQQVQSISGIDFNQPPAGPLPELAFDWQK